MDLRRLRYFVAVAEDLHFGRAARRLGLSQPPLSLQIHALEEEVGLRLLDRTKRRVSLTAAGELLLAEARGLLEHSERLRNLMHRARNGQLGVVSIGCVPSALYEVLPRLASRYRKDHPNLGLALHEHHTAEVIKRVQDGRIDVGLVWQDQVEAPLALRLLDGRPFVVALPAHSPLAGRKVLSLADLAGAPLIMSPRAITPRHYDRVIAAFDRAGVSPNIAWEVGSVPSQIGFVASGFGIAIVPPFARALNVGGLCFRDLDAPIHTVGISLIWNQERVSPQVACVLEIARKLWPQEERAGANGGRPARTTRGRVAADGPGSQTPAPGRARAGGKGAGRRGRAPAAAARADRRHV